MQAKNPQNRKQNNFIETDTYAMQAKKSPKPMQIIYFFYNQTNQIFLSKLIPMRCRQKTRKTESKIILLKMIPMRCRQKISKTDANNLLFLQSN